MKKVIILHGWTKNLDKWKEILDLLEKRIIKVNLPKIPGLTGNLEKVWELADYVEWLKNIVEKEKGKVMLVGHSNGGRIALAFTNQYPQKVGKLILIDSAGIYHNELPLKIKRVVFKTIAKIGAQALGRARLLDRRGNTKWRMGNLVETLRGFLYKLARESDYKDLDENTKQTMISLISADLKPIMLRIQTPTLIIWGREDKVTPLSDGKLMHELIKNSKLQIIENANHSPQFTHPSKVADAIVNNLTI